MSCKSRAECSRSKKSQEFSTERMNNKPVTKLPGVAEKLGERFTSSGYSKAQDVYKEAKARNFDRNNFEGWMKETTGANSRQAAECFDGIKNYYNQFDKK